MFAPAAAQDAPVRPKPQSAHTLVYDEQLRRVVLITGVEGGTRPETAEIWTLDGARWERMTQPGPRSRFLAAAAYDSKRNQIILFGGRAGSASAPGLDTWVWDGRSWREATDASVGVREHHSMAYDTTRDRIVMFGGTAALDPTPGPSARRTWPAHISEWDGSRWHRIDADGPGARNGAALTYDTAREQVVLFGGIGEDRVYRPGTWTWNGRSWSQTASEDPPLRATHQMAFDSRANVVLMYGGGYLDGTTGVRRSDMWQWDGRRWTPIAMRGPTPGPRVGHAMAYDRVRGRLVLFGGFSESTAPLGDTWEWDGARWTEIK